MLNVIFIYLVCLYLISLASKGTNDQLVIGILIIVYICLAAVFMYYCGIILAASAINTLGYFALTVFPVYLGLK